MSEIDEIELIRKHYGDFTGLYDPSQAVAHVKVLLAEVDAYERNIEDLNDKALKAIRDLGQERDEARAELARHAERHDQMRPVVEAAQAWHTALAAANDVGVQIQDLAAFRASEELCAAVDALAEPSELAAEDTTAAEPSGTEAGRACRADCDEIPGYCTSGWGCLGSGTEADRLPHAPCHMKPLHIAHPWGDPAHWCDGSGEAGHG